MQIIDPMPFLGFDSGLRKVRVTKAEAEVLRRAAVITERAHDLISDALGDGHYDLPDAVDLCLAGPALRALADGEVEW